MEEGFDEIASALLFSDAESALKSIHVARSRSEDDSQRMALMYARKEYESICKSNSQHTNQTEQPSSSGSHSPRDQGQTRRCELCFVIP